MPWVLLLPSVLLVAANAVLTVMLVRSVTSDSGQKRLQLLLVWLVPVAGAALTWSVLREERRPGARAREGGNEYLWWNEPDSHEGQSHSHTDQHSDHDG